MNTALLLVLWTLFCTQILSQSIQEIVEKDNETQALWTLIKNNQLENYFNDTRLVARHTFFAPENSAVSGVLTLDNETLLYHFLNYDGEFIMNEEVFEVNDTLFGDYLRVVRYNNKTYIGGLAEVKNTTNATDGTVHIIDKVLSWKMEMNNTVAEFLETSPNSNYTELLGLITYLDLESIFNDPVIRPGNSYTVFAPENSAFTNLQEVLPILKLEKYKSALTAIVAGHVLPGCHFSTEFTAGETLNLATLDVNHTLPIKNDNGVITVGTTNSVVVAPFDQQFRNGLVHTVSSLVLADGISLPVFTIADYVEIYFPKLYAQFNVSGLIHLLEEPGNHTLFAPLDESFNSIDNDTLKYHFINTSVNNLDNQVYETYLEGTWIRVNNYADGVYLNGENKLGSNNMSIANVYSTSNGNIHTLSSALTPTTLLQNRTIFEAVESDNATFGELHAALMKINNKTGTPSWIDLLNSKEFNPSFTVFAPENSAFLALPFNVLPILLRDDQEELLKEVLSYHVVQGTFFSTAFQPGNNTVTTLGGDIIVEYIGGSVYVKAWEDAQVTTANVLLRNGVVHVVNRVILPTSVIDKLQDLLSLPGVIYLEGLSEFNTQLTGANLINVLNNTAENFTIFAPNNTAFNSTAQLSVEQLSYHILQGKSVYSKDLVDDQAIEDLLNYPNHWIRFNKYGTGAWLNGYSEIVKVDQGAANGVVHVISKVLELPTTENNFTIFEYLSTSSDVSSLLGAIQNSGADFSSTLGNHSLSPSYTLFAPVNSAFENLNTSANNYTFYAIFYSGDKELLVKTLTAHVVTKSHFAVEIPTDSSVQLNNLNMETLTFAKDVNDTVTINGHRVSSSQMVRNGVVHLIEGLILPTLYEQAVLTKLENANGTYAPLLDALYRSKLLAYLINVTDVTLFAPIFSYLTWDEVNNLNDTQLTSLLQNHLVSGVKDLVTDQFWLIFNNPNHYIRYNNYGGKTYLNGRQINVDSTLTQATNQQLYKLSGNPGTFVQPQAQQSVSDVLGPSDDSHTFVRALNVTSLLYLTEVTTPAEPDHVYTFFVPTDKAFEELSAKFSGATLENLLSEAHRTDLEKLLKNHVLNGGYFNDAFLGNQTFKNFGDETFTVVNGNYDGTNLTLHTLTPVQVSNGVVYRVPTILIPNGWTFNNPEPSPDDTLAIALGATLGGLVLILIIVGIVCFARKKRQGYEAVKS